MEMNGNLHLIIKLSVAVEAIETSWGAGTLW